MALLCLLISLSCDRAKKTKDDRPVLEGCYSGQKSDGETYFEFCFIDTLVLEISLGPTLPSSSYEVIENRLYLDGRVTEIQVDGDSLWQDDGLVMYTKINISLDDYSVLDGSDEDFFKRYLKALFDEGE